MRSPRSSRVVSFGSRRPTSKGSREQYLENGELAELGMARNRELGRPDFYHPVQLIQQVFVGHKHYLGFCYDYASISTEMGRAGFEVHRCDPGSSDYPELRELEVRMHPAEAATSLVVEGVKPTKSSL